MSYPVGELAKLEVAGVGTLLPIGRVLMLPTEEHLQRGTQTSSLLWSSISNMLSRSMVSIQNRLNHRLVVLQKIWYGMTLRIRYAVNGFIPCMRRIRTGRPRGYGLWVVIIA